MRPVKMPPIPDNLENAPVCMAALYDHRAALALGNRRLRGSRNWYSAVRKDYAK